MGRRIHGLDLSQPLSATQAAALVVALDEWIDANVDPPYRSALSSTVRWTCSEIGNVVGHTRRWTINRYVSVLSPLRSVRKATSATTKQARPPTNVVGPVPTRSATNP